MLHLICLLAAQCMMQLFKLLCSHAARWLNWSLEWNHLPATHLHENNSPLICFDHATEHSHAARWLTWSLEWNHLPSHSLAWKQLTPLLLRSRYWAFTRSSVTHLKPRIKPSPQPVTSMSSPPLPDEAKPKHMQPFALGLGWAALARLPLWS